MGLNDMRDAVLLDANVLIDYQSDMRFVLEVLVACGWHFSVVADVLNEVLSGNYEDFPLEIIHPTPTQRIQCNDRPRRLSEQDMLCLLCAQDYSLACATNDVRLKKELRNNGIRVHTSITLLEAANQSQMLTQEAYEYCSQVMIARKYSE